MKPKNRPLFSIIIPTLNEEVCLPKLLSDLAAQSCRDFEIIHVDGGSTDKTVALAQAWKAKANLKTVTNSIKNVSAQRNAGARAATGQWLIFMDADNRLANYYLLGLRYQIEQARAKPKSQFDIFSNTMALNQIDKKRPINRVVVVLYNFFMKVYAKTAHPIGVGALIGTRREVFKSINFNEKNKVNEDNIFMRNCLGAGYKYRLITNPTYMYSMCRFNKNGVIKTLLNNLRISFHLFLGNDFSQKNYGYDMCGGSVYNYNAKRNNKNHSGK